MRFSDVKIGGRFILDGIAYTKTSPILATSADGKSRLIPRSAVLRTDFGATTPIETSRPSEVDRLYQAVIAIIREEVSDTSLDTRLRQAVDHAWRSIKETSN